MVKYLLTVYFKQFSKTTMEANLNIEGKYYKIYGLIGQGASAEVYLVRDNQNNSYALKIIRGYSNLLYKNFIDEEIRIQKLFKEARYIIKVLSSRQRINYIEKQIKLCQCSLSHWIDSGNQIFQDQFIDILCNTCEGIKTIHQKNIIHHDIKPANIIKKDGIYKITDFGVSCNKEQSETVSGTPLYWAPEILFQQEYYFNNKVDIWSLGITFFEVYFKINPFFPKKLQKIPSNKQYLSELRDNIKLLTPNFSIAKFSKFLQTKKLFKQLKYIQNKAKNTNTKIIQSLCLCFEPNPKERPDINGLLSILQTFKNKIQCLFPQSQKFKKFKSWDQIPEDIKILCLTKDLFYEHAFKHPSKLDDSVIFTLQLLIWYIQGSKYKGINYVHLQKIHQVSKFRQTQQILFETIQRSLSKYYFFLWNDQKTNDKILKLRIHILVFSKWSKIIKSQKYFCQLISIQTKMNIERPLDFLSSYQMFSEQNLMKVEVEIKRIFKIQQKCY